MKLTNNQIKIIINSTVSLDLEVSQASARRRIFRFLNEFSEDVETVRIELANKYADKEGLNPKHDLQGNFIFSRDNAKKFRKDYLKILDEQIEIKLDETNKKDWQTTKKILEDVLDKNKKGKMTAQNFEFVESLKEIVEVIK
jgi:hypothetical protein